jgi:hypothetical protein
MKRITAANRGIDLFGAGKDGFVDGSPTGGIPATFLNALWFNQVQEELCNVIEQSGQTLSDLDTSQLMKAVLPRRGANIAAASTITIGYGGYFYCIGAATISNIDFAADYQGRPVWLQISGTQTFVNSASMIVNGGGSNYTAKDNDIALVISEGDAPTGTVRVVFFKGDGTAVVPSAPPGAIDFFAANAAPTGWLKANGAAISRVSYAGLFATIGTTYGAGDGSTTFNIPDLRGEFLRGFDDGRGADPGRAFGSWQVATAFMGDGEGVNTGIPNLNDATHKSVLGFDLDVAPANVTPVTFNYLLAIPADLANVTTTGQHVAGAANTLSDFARTRPRNVALLACIKF